MSTSVEQEAASTPSAPRRRTLSRWPVYLLAALGLAAIVAGIAWQAGAERGVPGTLGNASLGLPARLAGTPASQPEVGASALKAIESMHGKGFPMVNGAVVRYGSAEVWVAEAKDQAGAKAMTEDMTARIAGGRSPFKPTGTRKVGGRTVYTLDGMGQSHFYWQAGTKVAWLAIDPAQAETGLKELLRSIK